MNKFYTLILLSSAAFAAESVTDNVKDVANQLTEVITTPANTIKDATVVAANKVTFVAKRGYQAAKNTAQDIANSEAGQDIADVANQLFVDAPCQVGADIKEGVQQVAQATKKVARKVADSEFVQNTRDVAQQAFVDFPKEVANNVKDASIKVGAAIKTGAVKVKDATTTATDKVVDAAKKSADFVKEKAQAVANSEAGQDVAEVSGQFAAVPGQVWESITEIFS